MCRACHTVLGAHQSRHSVISRFWIQKSDGYIHQGWSVGLGCRLRVSISFCRARWGLSFGVSFVSIGCTVIEIFIDLHCSTWDMYFRMAAARLGVARAMVAGYIGPDWCAEIKNLSWRRSTVVLFDFLVHFPTFWHQNFTIYALFTWLSPALGSRALYLSVTGLSSMFGSITMEI